MYKDILAKIKSKISDFFVQESGIVAIMAGLLFVLLIGFAALAIDASIWYSDRRQLQLAADAGAVGGAMALATTGKSTININATTDINLNNCSGASNCTIVAINNPPTSGPNSANQRAVEVILSKPADMFLSGLLLGTAPTLEVRAVAGAQPSNNCVVALSATGIGINVKGGASITSSFCGIAANSTASNAINVVGGGSITTSNVRVVGGTSTAGGGTINSTGGITTGAAPVADPFASTPMPKPGACTGKNNQTFGSGTTSINPGTYCGGIKLNNAAILNMAPGIYYMVQSGPGPSAAGNLTVNSQAKINATGGVTIVMTTTGGSTNFGTVNIPAQATVKMTAPTTGPTAGILFFGDRNSSGLSEKFNGGVSQTLSGALYFPTNNVEYSGQSGGVGNPCFEIVANTITLTGGGKFGNGCVNTTLGLIKLLE